MTKLLSAKFKTDPALARYPQALAELLTFGEPEGELDYTDWAESRWRLPVAKLALDRL